jgi:hypothetical protein
MHRPLARMVAMVAAFVATATPPGQNVPASEDAPIHPDVTVPSRRRPRWGVAAVQQHRSTPNGSRRLAREGWLAPDAWFGNQERTRARCARIRQSSKVRKGRRAARFLSLSWKG